MRNEMQQETRGGDTNKRTKDANRPSYAGMKGVGGQVRQEHADIRRDRR